MDTHPQNAVDAETRARRQAFYDRIGPHAMAPLWEVLRGLVPPEPRPVAKAHVWRWDLVRDCLMEAGRLLTAEEAERRVLVLENPAYRGQSRATSTLYAGVQLVLPGEVAPAHRHTQSALRFVLESSGGYTAVGGERTTMRPGDFVTTPAWSFHDHGNDTDGPALWMDVLDLPIVSFFEGGFAQHHNDARQSITRPEGDALARYGSGLLPLEGGSPYGKSSPVFNYPYERSREALGRLSRSGDPDAHWGYTLRYANPLDGGWALPTIASWMTHLPAGLSTAPARSTDGLICAVVEGRGTVSAGEQKLSFGPRDIFVVPNWTWRTFRAEEDCFMFFCSDRVVQEKLGLWRDERGRA
ncbi:gentisate 1,2-dioxygenase [Arenibaculum pallidiluteum]|uniref:gentisate 1,2-dioxygenase n=1 Tax=Arenibaculum pallidiluteum TaxID=2812559 RepID=UPI001F2904EF|nr:gentisate 1,2-dioxygenase [Arenibaculum pallidiluteum]